MSASPSSREGMNRAEDEGEATEPSQHSAAGHPHVGVREPPALRQCFSPPPPLLDGLSFAENADPDSLAASEDHGSVQSRGPVPGSVVSSNVHNNAELESVAPHEAMESLTALRDRQPAAHSAEQQAAVAERHTGGASSTPTALQPHGERESLYTPVSSAGFAAFRHANDELDDGTLLSDSYRCQQLHSDSRGLDVNEGALTNDREMREEESYLYDEEDYEEGFDDAPRGMGMKLPSPVVFNPQLSDSIMVHRPSLSTWPEDESTEIREWPGDLAGAYTETVHSGGPFCLPQIASASLMGLKDTPQTALNEGDKEDAPTELHEAASLRMNEVLRRSALFKGIRLRWLLFFLIILITVLVIIFFFQFLHFTNDNISTNGKHTVSEKASSVLGNTELLLINLISLFTSLQRLWNQEIIFEELCTRLSHSPIAFAMYNGTELMLHHKCPGQTENFFEKVIPSMSTANAAVQIVNHSPTRLLAFMRPQYAKAVNSGHIVINLDGDSGVVSNQLQQLIREELTRAVARESSEVPNTTVTGVELLYQEPSAPLLMDGDIVYAVLLDKDMVGRMTLSSFSAQYSAATLMGTYEAFVGRQWNEDKLSLFFHTLTQSSPTYNSNPSDLSSDLFQTFQSTCGNSEYVWHTVLHVAKNYSLLPTRNPIPMPHVRHGSTLGLVSSVTLCSVVCIHEDFELVDYGHSNYKGVCDITDPTNLWFLVDIEEFHQQYGIVISLVIGIVSIVIFSGVMGVVYLSVVVPVGFMRHQLFRTVGAQKPLPQWKKNLYQCSYPFWIGDISSLTHSLHVLGISFNLNKKYVPDHILRKHAKEMDLMRRKFRTVDLFDPRMERAMAEDTSDNGMGEQLEDLTEMVNLNIEGMQRDPQSTLHSQGEFGSGGMSRSAVGMAGLTPSFSQEGLNSGAVMPEDHGNGSGSGMGAPAGVSAWSDADQGTPALRTSLARDQRSSISNSPLDHPVSPLDRSGQQTMVGPNSRDQSISAWRIGGGVSSNIQLTTEIEVLPITTPMPTDGEMCIKRTEDSTILVVKLESIDAVYLKNYAVAARQHQRIMSYLLARIRHYGGAVFHRSGDCLAAAWNAFDTCPGHVGRAVACGMDIVEAFAAYRSVGLMVGVVVHAGMFVCGIIEDAKEAFSTAFGGAAREALTMADLVASQSTFGLIVSEPVKQSTAGLYDSMIVDVVKQEGDMHPIVLFELRYRRPPVNSGDAMPPKGQLQQKFLIQYAKLFAHFVQHEFSECIRLLEGVREFAPPEARGQLLRLEMLCVYFDTHPSEMPPMPYYRTIPSWNNYEKRAKMLSQEYHNTIGSIFSLQGSMGRSGWRKRSSVGEPGQSSPTPLTISVSESHLGQLGAASSSRVLRRRAHGDGHKRRHGVRSRAAESSGLPESSQHYGGKPHFFVELQRRSADAGNGPLRREHRDNTAVEAPDERSSSSALVVVNPNGRPGRFRHRHPLATSNLSMTFNSSSSAPSPRGLNLLPPAPISVGQLAMDEEEIGILDFRRELQDNIRRVGRKDSVTLPATPATPGTAVTPSSATQAAPVLQHHDSTTSLRYISASAFPVDTSRLAEVIHDTRRSANSVVTTPLSTLPSTAGRASTAVELISAEQIPVSTRITSRRESLKILTTRRSDEEPVLKSSLTGSLPLEDSKVTARSPVTTGQWTPLGSIQPPVTSPKATVNSPRAVLTPREANPPVRHVDPNESRSPERVDRSEKECSACSPASSSGHPQSAPPSSSSSHEAELRFSSTPGRLRGLPHGTSLEVEGQGSTGGESLPEQQENVMNHQNAITCSIIQSVGLTLHNTLNAAPAKPSSSGLSSAALPSQILAKNGILYQRSERVLGSGSFGSVFLGMDVRSGKLVAIKVLPLPTKEENRSNVEAEALIMRVKDPHVVEFISYAFVEQSIVIIMECMLAGSLQNLLVSFRALPKPTAQAFLRDVLRGLNKLHSMDVIHRDVKPQNVLLTPAGNCKITDFGASAELAKQAHGNTVHGTPVYLAPEAARGAPVKVSDIWSCGIMYMQLVTGVLPYPKEKLQLQVEVLVFQIGSGIATPVIPDTLDELELDFVTSCLDPEPAKRRSAARLLQCPMFSL